MKQERLKIREHPPHPYWEDIIEGDHLEVAKRIANMLPEYQKHLDEMIDVLKKQNGFSEQNAEWYRKWKLVDQIKIDRGYGEDRELEFEFYRTETENEMKDRLADAKKRSAAAKKAAVTRKKAQEKREKTLYETLKKKFGGK